MSEGNCFICGDLNRRATESGVALAYGEEALSRARFARFGANTLFVPVAPLHSNYLMISPLAHQTVPLTLQREASFERLLSITLRALEQMHGRAWAFEHASLSADGPSCVEHAHVHLLPGIPPLRLFQETQATNTDAPDVIVRTSSGEARLSVPRRQKQFVRRVLAQDYGLDGAWDWRVHRHPAIYRQAELGFHATLSILKGAEPELLLC